MAFEPCFIPEEPPHLDKAGYAAAGIAFWRWLSVRRRHDAPLGQAGALLWSPIVAGRGAMTSDHGSISF